MLRDSAGKPEEKQAETSALSELRSRLECMASDTHVEELLQMLSALQEWQRNPSHQIRDAMLKAATKLGVKRKDRKAPDVGQDMEAKILSRGIEFIEQRKLPNLFKRLQASAVKPAVAEDDDDNIEASDQQALAARLRSELQANMEDSAQQVEEARMRSRKLRKDLEQIYDKLMEQKADLPDCFLSEIVVSIDALQKWQRPQKPFARPTL